MFDIETIIRTGGIFLVALIVFAESGLLIGFFLPGDTLLLGAGLAASQGELSLGFLIAAVVIAAIIGDNVGYSIGRRTGHRIFNKKDGLIFRHEYLIKAEKFYEVHGGKTVVLARFVPYVRTFAPVVAGASKMTRRRFIAFNVVGALLWGAGMPMLGYLVGNRIPGLDKYIHYVIVGGLIFSVLIALIHLLSDRKTRLLLFKKSKDLFRNILLNKKVD